MKGSLRLSAQENAAVLFAFFALLFSAYMQVRLGEGSDKCWLLLVARMALEGKALYEQMMETNPPLIIWLYELPVWLGDKLGIQDYTALSLLALLLAGCSWLLCLQVIRGHAQCISSARRSAYIGIVLAFILVFFANPIYFADREYIFVVCVFPYLLAGMPSLLPTTLKIRLFMALMAALGFCIKPHCMLLWVGVQVMRLLAVKSLRVLFTLENYIIGFAWLSYIALVAEWYPAYFNTVLPMAMLTYAEYKNHAAAILFYLPPLLGLLVAMAMFNPKMQSPYRADLYYLLGLAGFALLYAAAGNGWLYMFYPLNSLVLFVVGWLWLEYRWLGNMPAKRGMAACAFVWGVSIFLTLSALAGELQQRSGLGVYDKVINQMVRLVRENHFTTFGAFSSASPPWPRIARYGGAEFATRFHMLWMMPKMALSGEEFRQSHLGVLRYVAEAYAEDLGRNKPQVVFLETSPTYGRTGKPIDIIAQLASFKPFTLAWGHYRFMQSIDYCGEEGSGMAKETAYCRYDVYVRKE